MRFLIPLGLALLLAGCVEITPTPVPIVSPVPVVTPPVNPGPITPVVNKGCQYYNTLQAFIPSIEQLLKTNTLSQKNQAILNDAVALVEAGCQENDASWQQRAAQVLNELALILQEN